MQGPRPEPQECSHSPCEAILPPGDKIPDGWTVARVEVHQKNYIQHYYLYICPSHKLTTTDKQLSMF